MRSDNGQFLKGTHWRPKAQHWDKEWLLNEYSEKGRSTGDIARSIGVTDAAIIYWLRKHEIKRRTVSEAREIKHWGSFGKNNPMFGKTGSKNPRYIDGSSPERQILYARGAGKEFIRSILKRDKYKCVRCGSGKTKSKSLHVHHIKSWAGNKDLRFNENNVVTLCFRCHNWVHSKKNETGEYLA